MSEQGKRPDEPAGQPPATEPAPVEALLARLEDLLAAFWPAAMSGDVKAGELARRVLGQQADMFGLRGRMMPAADEGVDELAKLRARRAAT